MAAPPRGEGTRPSAKKGADAARPVKGPATQQDVAAAADLSPSTVCRVIRGDASVSPRMRAKVEAAVKKVDYRVNSLARPLRSNGNVGLVALGVPDVSDPCFSAVHLALQRLVLDRSNSLLPACHEEGLAAQAELLHQMLNYRPAVIVLVPAPCTDARVVEEMQPQGVAVIAVNRPVTAARVDTIVAENEEPARPRRWSR